MNYNHLNERIAIVFKLNDSYSEKHVDKKGCRTDLSVISPFGILILLSIPTLITLQNMDHATLLNIGISNG